MLSKERLWIRGIGMPSYHSIEYDHVKLKVYPLGWRRLLRFIPYSQGDRVRFRIELKDKKQESILGRLDVYEDIELPNGSKKDRYPMLTDYYSQAENRGIPEHLDVTGSVLVIEGYGRYTIHHPQEKDVMELVTFRTWQDAKLIMWLIGVALPIVMFFLGRVTK